MNQNMNYSMYPNQYQTNYYPNNQVKRKRIWPFIVIPIIVFGILIVCATVLLFNLLFKKTTKYLDGEWKCDNNEVISFSSDSKFKIRNLDNDTFNVNGTYKAMGYYAKSENGVSTFEFNLMLTAVNDDNDVVSKHYEILIYGSEQNMMDLYDVENKETYYCEKIIKFV